MNSEKAFALLTLPATAALRPGRAWSLEDALLPTPAAIPSRNSQPPPSERDRGVADQRPSPSEGGQASCLLAASLPPQDGTRA